jgi:hypothetical protein
MPDRFLKFARILVCAALLLPLTARAQIDSWYRVELMVFSTPAGSDAEQWEATPDLVYPTATRFLTSPGGATPNANSTVVAAATAADPSQLTPFTLLPSAQQEFAGKADSMQRSGRYRILFHEAWLQPMTGQAATLPIVLDRSGDGGPWPALQGTIKLYLSSDLYLDTNLWLNTQGEYLHSAWRMPAPPLGPASTKAQGQPALSQLQAPGASLDTVGPAYPFRHAVLLKDTRRMRNGEVHYIDHPMLGVVAKITALSGAEPPPTVQPETAVPSQTTVSPKPAPETTPSA